MSAVYDGEFKGGLREGRGIYKDPSGSVYDGEFKGGVEEGKGVLKYPSGAVYDVEFKGGKLEGVYSLANGSAHPFKDKRRKKY